jgi:2,3-diaminopropionate biosynthesis protein SbnB
MKSWRRPGHLVSLPAVQISAIIASHRLRIIELVEQTYTDFYAGSCVNPDTYSLRFPNRPSARINALPAFLSERNLAGIKWVASFPENISRSLARATASIVLNCGTTGYPIAFLDGTDISAARTAASAALAARKLRPARRAGLFRLFGAGVLNREIADFLVDDGWDMKAVEIVDPYTTRAEALGRYLTERGLPAVQVKAQASEAEADLIAFATSALSPWYDKDIAAGQVVLHVSLRDIVPSRLAEARNIVDSIDHALKANTSLHLLEQVQGRIFRIENFSSLDSAASNKQQGAVVSAFGMGMLDIALADFVLERAKDADVLIDLLDIFAL